MKRTLFALVLAAVLPMSAQAGELSYSYVQGGYSAASIDGGDLNGFGVKGSIAFNDSFYGFVGYDSGEDNGVDLNQTALGAGWHSAGDTQWFVEAAFINNEVDFGGGFSADDNGYSVAGGVRACETQSVSAGGR